MAVLIASTVKKKTAVSHDHHVELRAMGVVIYQLIRVRHDMANQVIAQQI